MASCLNKTGGIEYPLQSLRNVSGTRARSYTGDSLGKDPAVNRGLITVKGECQNQGPFLVETGW